MKTRVVVYLLATLACLSWNGGIPTLGPPLEIDENGIRTAVWLPPRDTPGPWPIIVYSHGFRSCFTRSAFLTAALAEHGYIVFAPSHRDATCRRLIPSLPRPQKPFECKEEWTERTYQDRREDIEALISGLKTDPMFRDQLDWSRLGITGHSLGGYTALGLAGAWSGWKDERIRAVLALAPYAEPFEAQHTLHSLDAPVMYQVGTQNMVVTAGIEDAGGAYDQSPPPKYLVSVTGATHQAWSGGKPEYQSTITVFGIWFFDRYLKGVERPIPPTDAKAGIGEFRSSESHLRVPD